MQCTLPVHRSGRQSTTAVRYVLAHQPGLVTRGEGQTPRSFCFFHFSSLFLRFWLVSSLMISREGFDRRYFLSLVDLLTFDIEF